MNHVAWYKKWHEWPYHNHVHVSILIPYISIVLAIVLFTFKPTLAADLSNSWNFSNISNFIFDANAVETNGTSARLKAQNYTNDENTVALYHMDENEGTTVADSSSNGNNANLVGDTNFTTGKLNSALNLDGNGDYLSALDSPSLTLGGQNTLEAWTKFNNNFSTESSQDYGIIDKGSYKLYYDRTSGRINYEIASNTANSWTRQAGIDTNGSWDQDGKTVVRSSVIDGANRYVGLGLGTGDAEVWRWNGSSWSQIGGDGFNSSWADQTFEDVNALIISDGILYAGLGTNAAGDGEIWSCDISSECDRWTKIGGDGINGSWAINTYEAVLSLNAYGGNLYAGLGSSANDAEVWKWNGTAWTKIGGDSINSGWTTNYETVRALTNDGTNLYAGLGDTAGDGEVWKWNGTTWTKIGGDALNGSIGAEIEYVDALDYFGDNLYVGTGLTAGDGDVWKYNGTTWTKIGGDGVNGGWAASTYEAATSLTNDGTNLYAGLGSSDGDGEVWRWNGTAWTKIGGDGVNSGWTTAQGDGVYALSYGDGKLFSGLYDAAGNGTSWEWNGTAWTRTGGGYVNKSWGFYNLQSVESSATFNDKLYVGTGITVAGNAMVWEFNGASWNIVGGQGVNNSWPSDTYENVFALQQYKGALYAGLGTSASDAEVWRYSDGSWTKVGGDGVNSSWPAGYEQVNALGVYKGNLYAGLGLTAGDGEVWKYDGSTWTKIGGDGVNGSWATAIGIENVLTIVDYNGNLYAGLGSTTGDGEVWKYDGATWTKVGGDGINSSWNINYEEVYALRVYDGKLVAGLGNGTDDAEVWQYNGVIWTQIGGDDVNKSWTGGTYERVHAMAVYNGELYAGIGDTAGDGEVWKWNGTNWSQVGGDGTNSGWTNVIEYVSTLIDYKGKLYAGTGNSANVDASLWSIGNNAFLSSNQTSQDTNWHHIAATYNGSVMKIYIDGIEDASTNAAVSVLDNNLPLRIGSTFGSGGRGEAQGYFDGLIDEVRISSIARTSFTTKPYSVGKQTISLASAAMTSGIQSFVNFSTNETLNGGSITYRLSSNDGTSWSYWNGSGWVTSNSLDNANSVAEISDHVMSFPVTFDGIKWQAILTSDGNQQVTINSVTVESSSDLVAPNKNAENILAKKASGGATLDSGSWTNGASPYFSWDEGDDTGSGLLGYCLYLGQDDTANLTTTKGLLGNSPIDSGSNCQFVTPNNSIDLSVAGSIATPMTTSNSLYYLIVKAIDKSGNVYPDGAKFEFKFDNTPPTNPGFVNSPSGFISSKEATFTWPTNGSQAPNDGASGVAGLQYRINDSEWYGDTHNRSGNNTDLLDNDGTYTTLPTPDFDNIIDGINTVEFRTWDQAGNISSASVQSAIKINTNGAPSSPVNLTANPKNNSINSFSFSWTKPETYIGEPNNLNYCYTINTLPSVATCNYTGAGITSLSAGPYATQPGKNTLYVVAKDESSSINYDNYASVNFIANTTAPGIVSNIDIVDVSIKSTNNWRLAITWDAPSNNSVVSSYKIYRSADNSTFSLAGTSSSTTYIDAGLTQQTYRYRVLACDSTNNCSADSPIVSMLPTGKFTEPAVLISEPDAVNTTTKRTRIQWSTDRASDSKVALGTESGKYNASEIGNSDQVVMHEIDLDNLSAGTTYYYKAKWTDGDGNTGESQEFTFTTSPAPIIKEVSVTKVGLSNAVITFTSIGANKVNLYYGESESFGGLQSISTSSEEATYSMEITGLNDGTKYYYQLSTFDSEDSEYNGNIFSLTTTPRPKISNLNFQPVEGEPTSTQNVTWTTNVPGSSTITYGKIGTNGVDIYTSNLSTSHTITINGLEDDSQYFLIAQSRDADGNLAVSDKQIFKTALDTRPPSVFDINIETSIRGTGSEARGQVIVSWKTDEPSTSQVSYAEGSAALVFNNKTSEDVQMTTEHIVVLSNLPTSKVYSVQVVSYDKARNVGLGETQSAIIGRANESVLTIILSALQRVFGL